MMVFGMRLHFPSTPDLVRCALAILLIAVVTAGLGMIGALNREFVWPLVVGSALGVLAPACGLSMALYGWKAFVGLIVIGTIVFPFI